ncbi:TIGR02186 family protein [Pseudoroseicyclus sp. CXY001]|uniref:TIGR02186 family protein n=1 Tax=Pseudoroseicyclus sp. CXY001 TaxID=3242492 RepID=UPI00358DBCB4
MKRLALLLVLLLAVPATAPVAAQERLVFGLSQEEVAITATFDGDDLLIFGAIARESPLPADPAQVIVTISGPTRPVTVRHKERRFGIWVNTEHVLIDAAPSYYAVATSAPLEEVLTYTEDMRYGVTLPHAIRSVGNQVLNSADYTEALMRIRGRQGFYRMMEGEVDFAESTLFRTRMTLPANLTEGAYQARILLTRNGEVVDELHAQIPVFKVGLERWLYNLAQNFAPLYGLLALSLAAFAGWAASAAFSLLRR